MFQKLTECLQQGKVQNNIAAKGMCWQSSEHN
jgi:hypothetical protein